MPPPRAPWLRRHPRLALTLAIWTFSSVLFWFVLVRDGLPGWGVIYLGGVVALGLAFCGLLVGVARLLEHRPAPVRWAGLAFAAAAISAAHTCADPAIYRLALHTDGRPFSPVTLTTLATNLLIYVWLYGLYAAALEVMAVMQLALAHERQAAAARAMAQDARLEALRLQLNPHFLFNTLNAISSLVLSRRNGEAEAMLLKLSEFLRATLTRDQDPLQPLAVELGMMDAYLEIEAVRFGPRLQVRVDCPEGLHGALVPSFILQPLVENAVTHAIAPAGGAGRIEVSVAEAGPRLAISVRDVARTTSRAASSGGGLGLRNVRERLAAHYGADGSLATDRDARGFVARVELPLAFAPQGVPA